MSNILIALMESFDVSQVCACFVGREEGQQNNESSCIGKEDLRQVQGHNSPRCGEGDLRERKA